MKHAILQCGILVKAHRARSNLLIPQLLDPPRIWSVACEGKRQDERTDQG